MHIALLMVSFLIPVIALFFFPLLTRELIRDLRPLRILHYVSLSCLGIALFLKEKKESLSLIFSGENLLVLPLWIISLTYAAVFAIITNNIEDVEADKISNPLRPLVVGSVDRVAYLKAGIFCLGWSLFISFFLQPVLFLGILVISAGYYIYSCRPFRLKRIPVLAKFFIGFNSFTVAVCGYVLAGGRWVDFPLVWSLWILLPLSFAANFIDLKDREGDKKSGIKTLPVLWGDKKARLFIAIATLVTYGMAACILQIMFLYFLTGFMAALHCYFLYKKPYNETHVFLVYIAALSGLTVILIFYAPLLDIV